MHWNTITSFNAEMVVRRIDESTSNLVIAGIQIEQATSDVIPIMSVCWAETNTNDVVSLLVPHGSLLSVAIMLVTESMND
jgi:hypothetical protein